MLGLQLVLHGRHNTRKNIIFYTGNVSPKSDKIVKTNRYTQKTCYIKIILYEWDYMNEEIVRKVRLVGK